jgi:hypothetical protein
MDDSVAAIRAGRPRTRFTSSPSHRREAKLGLARSATVPVTPLHHGRNRARPLRAVREAARGLTAIAPLGEGHLRIRRSTELTWSSAIAARRRPSSLRSAAPWRA